MSNKKTWVVAATALLTLIVAVILPKLNGAPAAKFSMGMPTAFPTFIPIVTSSIVTVTVAIPVPALIPGSVNILRITDSSGVPVIIAVMHDDGQNGDLVAGDRIYTAQLQFKEIMPTVIHLQVSAAFRGAVTRVTSSVINLNVTPNGIAPLPPDPGPAGRMTLAGIDADGDGVRDDVQRFIALTYPQSLKIQSALTQLAKAHLAAIEDASDQKLSNADVVQIGYALECLSASGITDVTSTSAMLDTIVLNTPDRSKAYISADGQSTSMFYTLSSDPQSRCIVSPSVFPN